MRPIRIGLLGLGQVGQAVARLAQDRCETERLGPRFVVERALVRDRGRSRDCGRTPRLTTDPSAFLRGDYDVAIEALGSVEPARTIVARLLWQGTPVVTANKALVAAHGDELRAIAAEAGVAFRYEACALSAVPFLGMLAARPLVAAVDRVAAIVNGTSNFILTRLAQPGATFEGALEEAQRAGYAEPDSSRDLEGADAADKLRLLASLFGWGTLPQNHLEIAGIRDLDADDLAAARAIGCAIKPLVWASRGPDDVRAFVGPALLPNTEPLAALGGALNGIRLDGKHVSNLFFSGPGAGPDVTAATLLDDAVEAAFVPLRPDSSGRLRSRQFAFSRPLTGPSVPLRPPITSWFVRLTFPGVVPTDDAVRSLSSAAGLHIEQLVPGSSGPRRWFRTDPQCRDAVVAACAELRATHRIDSLAIRALVQEP